MSSVVQLSAKQIHVGRVLYQLFTYICEFSSFSISRWLYKLRATCSRWNAHQSLYYVPNTYYIIHRFLIIRICLRNCLLFIFFNDHKSGKYWRIGTNNQYFIFTVFHNYLLSLIPKYNAALKYCFFFDQPQPKTV